MSRIKVAAERLGITDVDALATVSIAGDEFAVIGILEPLTLHPDLDRSVLIGENITSAVGWEWPT